MSTASAGSESRMASVVWSFVFTIDSKEGFSALLIFEIWSISVELCATPRKSEVRKSAFPNRSPSKIFCVFLIKKFWMDDILRCDAPRVLTKE